MLRMAQCPSRAGKTAHWQAAASACRRCSAEGQPVPATLCQLLGALLIALPLVSAAGAARVERSAGVPAGRSLRAHHAAGECFVGTNDVADVTGSRVNAAPAEMDAELDTADEARLAKGLHTWCATAAPMPTRTAPQCHASPSSLQVSHMCSSPRMPGPLQSPCSICLCRCAARWRSGCGSSRARPWRTTSSASGACCSSGIALVQSSASLPPSVRIHAVHCTYCCARAAPPLSAAAAAGVQASHAAVVTGASAVAAALAAGLLSLPAPALLL